MFHVVQTSGFNLPSALGQVQVPPVWRSPGSNGDHFWHRVWLGWGSNVENTKQQAPPRWVFMAKHHHKAKGHPSDCLVNILTRCLFHLFQHLDSARESP